MGIRVKCKECGGPVVLRIDGGVFKSVCQNFSCGKEMLIGGQGRKEEVEMEETQGRKEEYQVEKGEFLVEKNVKIPTASRSSVWENAGKYPFDRMEKYDSFFIPAGDKKEAEKFRTRVFAALGYLKKDGRLSEEYQITTRKLKDGVRVWRIA